MSLVAYLRLCRPTITAFSVLAPLGLLSWSGNISLFPKSLLIFLAVLTGSLGWTVFNEVHDLPSDRINKPWKPLPRGEVELEKASIFSMFFLVTSMVLNFVLLAFDPVYLVGFAGQIVAYVYNGLSRDLFGNLCLSLAYVAAAFLCLYPRNLMFLPAYFLLILAHNAIVQHQDLVADRTAGVKTLPQQLGNVGTFTLVLGCSALSTLLFLSAFPNDYAVFWFATASLAVAACIPAILIRQEKPEEELIETFVRRFSRLFQLIGYGLMVVRC